MRICFVGWADHVHVERWAAWFARAGHDVSVISFGEEGSYPPGVRQHSLGLQGRGWRFKALKLAWLLHRIRPELVHVHWAHFAFPVTKVWHGPLVITAWGSDIYRRSLEPPRALAALKQSLQAAHVITCDSQDLAREVIEFSGINPERAKVVQWGIDMDTFHRVDDNPFARLLGIEGRQVVFSARNFLPVYNQEIVVEAFARVRQDFPQAVLLMKNYNGNADYLRRVMELAATRGITDAVRLVETVPHHRLAELYSMATVTVSVPSSDATPMALFEAMACGSVPVFSDLPSLREWVVDGENGYLVAPDDVDKLAELVCLALGDQEKGKAIIGRNKMVVTGRASQRSNMMRMEDIYRSLVGKSPSQSSPGMMGNQFTKGLHNVNA